MAEEKKVIRKTDAAARALGRQLMSEAAHAAMAVLEPLTGMPLVSRVAVDLDQAGAPLILASELSGHSKALAADPRASILFGEPGRGDPLAHPRITVIGRIERLERSDEGHAKRRSRWLKKHPKAELYIDFGDFHFFRMTVERANLNGGFGKAYELTPADLGMGET